MSWRSKYTEWYRILEPLYTKTIPNLTDQEIMENVSPEDVLTVPTGQEHLPRNKRKPQPQLYIKLRDTSIETGITYIERDSIDLLKNLSKDNYQQDLEQLLQHLSQLPPEYETHLYSKNKDTAKPVLKRKYVSNRLDQQLLVRLIEEAESLRRGGRQIQGNQSTYVPPETPELIIATVTTPLDKTSYTETHRKLSPIYKTITGIKTQREKISERLSKPRVKRNLYREYIEALNNAQRRDLITPEKRRKLNKQWRENEEDRDTLLQDLKELLASTKF